MNEFNKQYEKWIVSNGPDCDGANGFQSGWQSAIEEVLKILEQPIQNADLSWDDCDQRFIDKIEKL